jgi:hypothetical protein
MGRGRPKGSKNKSTLNSEALELKQEPIVYVNDKDIKKEIRALRKLKLQCRPRTPERLDLEHRIKALKKQLKEVSTPEPEKEKLITEILKIDTLLGKLDINLNKFTIKELQKHLDIITKKGIK